MYFTELCLKYAWEKYPLTLVWSLDWNDKRQADYISQCQKNPNLIEPEIVNDEMIETAKYLWEFWLEISWLQTIWRSWWSLIAYWTWYITNDLYLTEIGKQNLKSDLLAVSQELNPLKKIKIFKNFVFNFKNWLPDYILTKRAPIPSETFLKSWYNKTWKIYTSWASIYKDNNWYYYYIDRNHKWTSSHIEVFDYKWNHVWEANPISWLIDYSKIDQTKYLDKSFR